MSPAKMVSGETEWEETVKKVFLWFLREPAGLLASDGARWATGICFSGSVYMLYPAFQYHGSGAKRLKIFMKDL